MELYDAEKSAILAAALPNIPFDGWTDKALREAAISAGLNPAMLEIWFPRGALDAIVFQHQQADAEMVAAIAALPLDTMRIPQKIKEAVMIRLRQQQPHRAAIRSAAGILSFPTHCADALKLLYGTVDAMWHATGDQTTDFNYYTKRMTLSAVYSTTVLIWLNDETPDLADTSAFLDRRLKDVHSFGKTTQKYKDLLAGLMPKKFG